MNKDFCLQSYRNNYQDDGAGAGASKLHWFQKTRIYKVITNPMFIVCLIIFIGIIVVIYWNYIRPRQFKTIYKKLLQFAGFKYSHLTNQEREAPQDTREASHNNNSHNNSHCNAHFIIYGSSGSGKTSFLKHYLAQRPHDKSCDNPRSYLVFGRDEREFPSQNFVPLLQLEKVSIESLANKSVVLDDAGAYKNLRLKVEDLFRFGRHLGIQVIYLARFAKDVLPIVRENCFKIYLTIYNPDNFFESIAQTYAIASAKANAINGLNWKYYRDQLEYGIIELDTKSQKFKILNDKYNLIYDSSKRSKWGPEQLVAYESYFFTGDEYNKLKIFLEEMSDQTIEITPLNIAYYYVAYCKQNKIKVNESKIDNYVERMQKPLICDSVKEDFKKLIYDHAKKFTKSKLNNV